MANEINLRPRQSEYLGELHDTIGYRLALLGFTIKQIAVNLDSSQSTIYRWFKQYPSFRESVNRGRAIADAKVAEALYRCATGYYVDIEEFYVLSTGRGQQEVVRRIITKYYPPNLRAAMFWLENRQPHLWSFTRRVIALPERDYEVTLQLGE